MEEVEAQRWCTEGGPTRQGVFLLGMTPLGGTAPLKLPAEAHDDIRFVIVTFKYHTDIAIPFNEYF